MPRIFYFIVVVVFCMLPDFANAQAKPKRDISNDRSVSVARSVPKKNVTNQTARKNSTMHSSVPEAYAVMSGDGTILTFYYDGNKKTRKGVVYGLNNEYDYPGWCKVKDSKIMPSKVKTVVFDKSFKAARPT